MRDIKFRAWNKKTKTMIDPHKLTPLTLHKDCAEMQGVFLPFHEDVELMQYTGLNDKNGKEIYEGDILRAYYYNDKWDDGAIGDVSWNDAGFRFNWKILLSKKGKREHRNPISTICSSRAYESEEREGGIEIIGNIYENPELIGGKK